jgi:hypothetical protein
MKLGDVCLCCTKGHMEVYFYTGVPSVADNPLWHQFWSAKLLAMKRMGINTFSRPLRYRHKEIRFSDSIEVSKLVGEEKGIHVRIALDIIRLVRKNKRGINNTDWIEIDRTLYDDCIDQKDYRPKQK